MQLLLPAALGLVLLSLQALGCETDCCKNSTDCCKSSTNCCSSSTNCCSTSTNCCQSTSNCCKEVSNCCHTCQTRCRTSTCNKNCKNDCCTDNEEKCKPDNSTGVPPIASSRPSSSANSNSNNNNHNLAATININNTISNENRISIPINVANSNVNNVVVKQEGWGSATSSRPVTDDRASREPIIESTTTPCPIKEIKVPVPVPVPGETQLIPIPVPMPFPITQPTPGCCIIMNPCVSFGCNSFHRSCDCSHDFMYRPVDPCQGHCHRRPVSLNRHCSWSGGCQHNWMDCSMCNTDFYQTYEGYQQCGGCFYR